MRPSKVILIAMSVVTLAASTEKFAAREERAIDIFRQLAQQSQVVISVSGELIGSDHKLISIDPGHAEIADIMTDICTKDPRYKWRQAQDRTIEVSVGDGRLTLDKVTISTIVLNTITSSELTVALSSLPEVRAWKAQTKCSLMQVFLGQSQQEWHLNVSATNESFSQVLNRIAVRNQTCIWSAIRIANHPCTISLNP